MTQIKVVIFGIIFACALSLLIACQAYDIVDPNDGETRPHSPNTDPTGSWVLNDQNAGDFLGIYTETTYDQIVVTPGSETFSLQHDDYFSCTIANHNVGYGFFLFGALYVDKYVDGQWIRQYNKSAEGLQSDPEWVFIGEQDNVNGINSTISGISISDISPKVTPGKYRFVVFTPVNTLYAEFDVQE